MITIDIGAGRSLDRDFRALDPFTGSAAAFDGTEALACAVWEGDRTAAVATPAVAWIDASAGTYRVAFAADDTAELAVGLYSGEVTVAIAGRVGTLLRFALNIQARPGSDADSTAPNYCTYADMENLESRVRDMQGDADRAGLPEQRARASRWLEKQVESRLRRALAEAQAGMRRAGYPWAWSEVEADPQAWLEDHRAAVAAGRLDTADPDLAAAVAHKALSYVSGPKSGDDQDEIDRAAHSMMANRLLSTWIARIDVDDDGVYEVELP